MKTHLSAEGRVITFGLSKEENTNIKNALPTQKYELLDTDAPTDLIAISAAALIINASVLDAESREMIFDYYAEVGACTDETVFWIGNPKPPKQLLANFKCYGSFEELAANLKYHLLSAHRKSKKAKDFSKQLGNCLQIMLEIKKKPGVRTQELADAVGISVRTTQRYIAALQYAGEWIEYNDKKKGWYLQYGKSPYFENY